MIENNMNSVIIKTCAFGLTRDDLLKSLKDLQPTLLKLASQQELNVCGEGGEFESLTLDCPIYKKKINILEFETVVHSKDAFTEVTYAIIKKWEIVEKI
jgi:diphthine-ammonia ligase